MEATSEQLAKERRELSHVWKQVEADAKNAADKEERLEQLVATMLAREKERLKDEEKKLKDMLDALKDRERAAKDAESEVRRSADKLEGLQRTLEREEEQKGRRGSRGRSRQGGRGR